MIKANNTAQDRSPLMTARVLQNSVTIKVIARIIIIVKPTIGPTFSLTESLTSGTITAALIPKIGPLHMTTKLKINPTQPHLVAGLSFTALKTCLAIIAPTTLVYTLIVCAG